ncbi:hypothetical protein VroAM7_10850 [Vibrio rotiferianus]|uniref:Type I restriction modification DNA specificity domain-containing protein n=1 Tax=Vibrio rotiferianus TaxID=190895 RepID=A0A510I421_9VIBR|nr:restriction endonuclease subunit S [Vibrio rotiferianus]BBL88432.1 hypothetical protein VroAM7_10850 [Vibrio rotiferianus]
MGSEWKTVCIDQIKSPQKYSCVGGPFGSSLSRKHYVDSGVPVIRGVNLSGDIFSESEFVFVSPEKSQELQRNMAFRGDLVFTQRGTLGQVALIPENSDYECYVVSQSQMKLTVDPTKADPYFIYSYFRSKEAKTVIEKSAIVGGVPHINLGILKDFKLRLPPLSVQQAVSKIAKDFDRKMLLNNQINQTLEQMAQTLFKSWFVDYDPVIDNALDVGNPIPEVFETRVERRKAVRESADFKPLPDDVRQLFPSEFEEIELGWVPKGWSRCVLSDIARYGKERIDVESLSLDNYISTENMLAGRKGVEIAAKLPTVKTVPAYSKGYVLVSNIRPYFKKIWLANELGGYSNDVLGFAPTYEGTEEYIFNLLYQDQFFDYMMTTSKGSKMPRGDKKAIADWEVVMPPHLLMQFYSQQVASYYEQSKVRNLESKTLEKLRDTLLPKLISGELRLDSPEVEHAKALME